MLDNEIKKLIKILEESKIDELEISSFWGRQKIRIRKSLLINSKNIDIINDLPPNIEEENKKVKIDSINNGQDEELNADPSKISQDEVVSAHNTNTISIKAPLVGTYYKSPKPDSPPFISKGDKIIKGQIIGIIEAMKIFNEIESEYSGTIIDILIEDSTPVEYDQDLLIISPD